MLAKTYEVRHTPAGIPISRFILEHKSQQSEADLKRKIQCRVLVIVSGNTLNSQLQNISIGQEITVEGYLNQISFQGKDNKLCINAEKIIY